MGKKKYKIKQQTVKQLSSQQKNLFSENIGISKKGFKIIIFSIFSLAIGFLLLRFTNSEGDNWASIVSPIIIISSYIFIAIGILAKD